MDINSLLSILAAVIGWVVLALVSAYAIPQLLRVVKTKNTSGLSIPGYILFIFSNLGMLAWGIGNTLRSMSNPEGYDVLLVTMALVPNIILNLLNASINVFILVTKIHHVRLAKKMGIDETKLASILLKEKKNKTRKAGK